MSIVRHSIRQQTLELTVDTELLALALQPRIGDINRWRLLPAIERVLDEFDIPEQHVRIARLDIDLGDLPAGNFEQAAEEALYPALRRAVADALHRARGHPSSDHEIRPEGSSQLGMFEHYLLRGTLPFWARAEEFSAESLLLQLAASNPADLVATISRHARDRRVLERVAFQLDSAGLEALLRLLSPEHAALILAYMFDLRQTHRVAPLVALSETAFAHLLWVLVLNYLLNDPGSQFNRKSFVRSLLEGMAEPAGFDYRSLVETLRRGLDATQQRHSLTSSLPVIVAELERELASTGQRGDASPGQIAPVRVPAERPADAAQAGAGSGLGLLAQQLLYENLPPSSRHATGLSTTQLVQALLVEDPNGLCALLRTYGRQHAALRRLIETLGDDVLQRVLALLDTEHAAAIIACVAALRQVHRKQSLLKLSDDQFTRLLWLLVLTYLLREPGTSFNRKTFVRSLLVGMAEQEKLDHGDFVAMLSRGLQHAKTHDSSSSLLTLIQDLAIELELPPQETLVADADGFAGEVLAGAGADTAPIVQHQTVDHGWSDPEARDLLGTVPDHVFKRYDQIEILRHYLHHGLLPWGALLRDPGLSVEGTLASLTDLTPAQLRLVFAGSPAEQSQLLEIALRQLSEDRIVAMLVSLLPQGHGDSPFRSALATFSAQASDRPVFYGRIITALLDHVAVDLEKAAAEARPPPAPEPLRMDILALWGTGTLKSLLVNRLRFGATVWPEAPASGEILHALVARHGGEARHFLEAVADARALRRALVQQVAPALLQSLLDLLYPGEASALRAFTVGEAVDAASDQPKSKSPATALQEAVFTWLREGYGVASRSRTRDKVGAPVPKNDTLVYALERMIATEPEHVAAFVRQHAADPERRARWADVLPDSALARLIYLLAPRQQSVLLAAAEILVTAWREAAPAGQRAVADRALLWNFLLDITITHGDMDLSRSQFVAAFFARTASTNPRLATGLLHHAVRLAEAAGNAALLSVLQRDGRMLRTGRDYAARALEHRSRGADRPRADPGKSAFHLRPDDKDFGGEPIYISNAGLVLTSPFLPHLFHMLHVLERDDNGRQHLRDYHAVSRAAHLLQYLVNGRTDSPEPLLVLNKLLCGVPVQTPIARAIEPTDAERALCDRLLRAITAEWKIIKHTSTAGLRETFLQREGKLQRDANGWKLRVQRKTLDVLVDRIPWSISVVFQPWMSEPIHVSW